ncbi:AAA family ATPase [Bacterioplanoides pacificum]|uniref:AAA family ATPase n=1 Tax=Bacterioplanoides pacificum TaxID=1171596 RepID=A0ABV7VQX2_9GAMM
MINLDLKISHRNWEEALNMLFALLIHASPGEVVCVTGPARTGKTRIIEELRTMLDGPNTSNDDQIVATAYVLVDNDGNNGRFTTKSFIWDALVAIRHPGFYGLTDTENITRKFDRSSEAAMKKAFIVGAKHRKLKYLFFDEAQHVNYVAKGADAPHMVLDSWKNMAKQAGVVLVLAGAYPMLDTLRNSPHLIGRQYKVNLPRYYENKDDLNEFASIVGQYSACLPDDLVENDLVSHTRYLHRHTFGCIGLLRLWLLHAAVYAKQYRTQINKAVLESTRATDDDLKSIGREIAAGEEILFRGTDFSALSVPEAPCSPEDQLGKPVKKSQRIPFKAKQRRYKPGSRTAGEE